MNISNFILKDELKEKVIFLSASIPSADRNEIYYVDTNPLNITDAIVALTKSILSRKGKIVFGGHPTISPLILSVAKNFITYMEKDDFPLINIYQSKFFEGKISKFTEELLKTGIGKIEWTIKKNSREESLTQMRIQMIKENNIDAAIFIGGMEGIEEEYRLFNEIYPQNPLYLIASTGGATRLLFEKELLDQTIWKFKWRYNNDNLIDELYHSIQFNYLVKTIISDIVLRYNKS